MLKVVCAIIKNEQKFLVTQIPGGCQRGFEWEFPGGKIEEGENAEAAIVREIKEELSVEIVICEPMKPFVHNDGKKEFELIPFLCRIVSGTIVLTEHSAMKWIEYEQTAETNFSEADKGIVQLPENQEILKKYAGKNVDNAC